MNAVKVPVNVLARPGVPDFDVLQKLGVARVSFGPNLHRAALRSVENMLKSIHESRSHHPVTGQLV